MGAAAGEGLVPPSRCPNSRTKGGAAHLDMVLLCAAFEINPSLFVLSQHVQKSQLKYSLDH